MQRLLAKIYNDNRGVALYIVLSTLIVIVTIIMVLTRVLTNGVDMSASEKKRVQYFYIAESALERVKGLYKAKVDRDFFNGCLVNQCINFSAKYGCTPDCNTTSTAIQTFSTRYKARVRITNITTTNISLLAEAWEDNTNVVATATATTSPRCWNDNGDGTVTRRYCHLNGLSNGGNDYYCGTSTDANPTTDPCVDAGGSCTTSTGACN